MENNAFSMIEVNRPVNIQEIIPLVEKKPVLWDHCMELFKHKNATLAAWDEICSEYNTAYETLSEAEKNSYRNIVIRKWRNVKDSWRKNLIKTIKGQKVQKKYVYDKELLFLKQGMKMKPRKKKKCPSTPAEAVTMEFTGDELSRQSEFQIKSESLNTDIEENDSREDCKPNEQEFNGFLEKPYILSESDTKPRSSETTEVFHEMPSFSFSQSTTSNPTESDIHPLVNSREQEDRHISFIKGVLPSLRNFNERQVLKFQMGVLELIQSIRENCS